MAATQRAVDQERKEARREAILDAVERLLDANRAHVPSVAEVADAAGLAKGTVYLYFASKERLLVALYERQIEAFFAALAGFLDPRRSRRLDDFPEQVLAWLADHPLFVALAALCHRAPSDGESPGGRDTPSLHWQILALVVGLVQLGRAQHDVAGGVRALWRGFAAHVESDTRPEVPEAGAHVGRSTW